MPHDAIDLAIPVTVAIWLAARRPWRRPRGEPVCGHCRYRARGLTTFVCPECGSDLREVGIIRPRARLGLPTALLIWTAAFALLAGRCYAPLKSLLPEATTLVRRTREQRCIFSHAWRTPYEGVVLTLRGECTVRARGAPSRGFSPGVGKEPPITEVELEARPLSGTPSQLIVRREPSEQAGAGAARVIELDELEPEVVLELLRAAGIDTNASARNAEARAIVATVRGAFAGQPPRGIAEFPGFGWMQVANPSSYQVLAVSGDHSVAATAAILSGIWLLGSALAIWDRRGSG